jgi:hypothetical protein
MNNRNYCKWLIVCALGFMGLTWDASFFFAMILGNGTVTISEPNTFTMWAEFICISLAAIFVFVVMVKHLCDSYKSRAKRYTMAEKEYVK